MVIELLHTYLIFLEFLVFLYFLNCYIGIFHFFQKELNFFVDPILVPIRFLLKQSVFWSKVDLSPLLTLIVIWCLQELFCVFLRQIG